jgi:uncharacterized membrane protein
MNGVWLFLAVSVGMVIYVLLCATVINFIAKATRGRDRRP